MQSLAKLFLMHQVAPIGCATDNTLILQAPNKDIHGQNHELEAPLPKDMRALLQQLKKNR